MKVSEKDDVANRSESWNVYSLQWVLFTPRNKGEEEGVKFRLQIQFQSLASLFSFSYSITPPYRAPSFFLLSPLIPKP